MEMEMDKFLAKKSVIYNRVLFRNQFIDKTSQADLSIEFQLLKSILHLCIKAVYEHAR